MSRSVLNEKPFILTKLTQRNSVDSEQEAAEFERDAAAETNSLVSCRPSDDQGSRASPSLLRVLDSTPYSQRYLHSSSK